MLKTVSSITNAIGALNFKGTWNASTNTPTIVSGVGVKGDYFVVSVAGSTTIDGISNWGVGDWITYNGTVWQRVEGGADLNGVNLSVSGTTTLSNLTASTALALNASKEVVSVTNTGTGDNVLATSPTLVTPILGTPQSGTLTNATGLPLSTGVTGTLPVTNGGTGTSTAFTAGSVVFAGTSGIYSQDNANLFWDDTNNILFVGKTSSGTATGIELKESGSLTVTGDNQPVYNTVQNSIVNSNNSNTDLIEFNCGRFDKTAIYVGNAGAAVFTAISHIVFQYGTTPTTAGSITSSGATVTYGSASDVRLKNDLGISASSRVADVVIHDFEWKATGVKARGAFAQELHKVVPEAVAVGTDDLNNQGELKMPWQIDYSKLVPDLIIEIQLLRKRVTDLEVAQNGSN